MFLLNSRLMRFAATLIAFAQGTPYPEVTGSICLVPEHTITRAPENTLLDHLCRFVVRILEPSLAAFPGSRTGVLYSPVHPFTLVRNHSSPRLTVCVPASVFIESKQSRNINRVSIGYAFRPHLRLRLTLSGLTFLRNP